VRERPKWTDVAIVGLTLGIVYLAYMQWREMHGSGEQTDKIIAADERLAAANERFATAMENSVAQAQLAMQKSIQESDKALNQTIAVSRLDQRAWVGMEEITGIPPTPEVDKVWDIAVSLKNSGKTPAKNILMWNTESVLKELPNVNSDCNEAIKQQASKSILPPNGVYKAILHVGNGTKIPSDWEKELSDTGALYIDGCVLYDDVFGRAHWMTYCGAFDPSTKNSFQTCKKYNDTGDGKPPR
jgi:hypothetical protein